MKLPVGSSRWLMAHELRLTWRGVTGRRGARWLWILGLLFLGMFIAGVPIGLAMRRVEIPVVALSSVIADIALAVIFTLMLSQTLAAATEALYARADLDLLFSSPIAPRKVLTVRFAAIAASAFGGCAVLVTPFLLPIAVLGHPAWLAVYLVLAALALIASAAGLSLATLLFRLLGPRRTRAVAQVLAALIGAAFFLVAQSRNLLGAERTKGLIDLIARAARGGMVTPPTADWPLRAMLGQPLPLLAIMALGVGLFLVATNAIGRRFAADAAAASGAGQGRRKTAKISGGFAQGAFAVTLRKELRLLVRDVPLLSQVLFRVFYMLPLVFILLRNGGHNLTLALPSGVGAVTFLASQVAASLTWVTLSAEDTPELIASAPAPMTLIWRAKLVAGLLPLGVMLAPPAFILLVLSPRAGVCALVFWPVAALASGLISQWRQRPAKRAEFRRRASGSYLTGWAQLGVGMLVAGAAGLATAPSIWANAGAVVLLIFMAIFLALLHRDEAQIMDGLLSGKA